MDKEKKQVKEVSFRDKIGKHLKKVLKKMCKVIDIDFSDVNFDRLDWFMQYTWSEEQYNEFIEWLAEYLYKNKGAREELCNFDTKSKKYCRAAAEFFGFQFGWASISETEKQTEDKN